MITARNYINQAKLDLKVVRNNTFLKGKSTSNIDAILGLMNNAQHFAMPDNGLILDNHCEGLYDKPFHLPYPTITIEFFINKPNGFFNKAIIVCTEKDNMIEAYSIMYSIEMKVWHLMSLGTAISCDKPFTEKGLNYHELLANDYEEAVAKVGDNIFKEVVRGFVQRPLMEMLQALTCKNIYINSLEFIDPKKNERRIKAGKLPFYETKILCVKSTGSEIDKTHKGGTHASPRQHLRRGHIRRYATYNIWINSQIIGKSSNGIISKSYEVR